MTRAMGPARSVSCASLGASASAPTIHRPASLSRRSDTRQVGHHRERRGFGGARRDLAHRRGQLHGTILGNHHRERAAGIRGTQAGAEVVGILHAIEHQHEGFAVAGLHCSGDPGHQLFLAPGLERLHVHVDALVHGVTEQLLEGSGGARLMLLPAFCASNWISAMRGSRPSAMVTPVTRSAWRVSSARTACMP